MKNIKNPKMMFDIKTGKHTSLELSLIIELSPIQARGAITTQSSTASKY